MNDMRKTAEDALTAYVARKWDNPDCATIGSISCATKSTFCALEDMKAQYDADPAKAAAAADENDSDFPTLCEMYPEYKPTFSFGCYYDESLPPCPKKVRNLLIQSKNGVPQPDGLSEAEAQFYNYAAKIRLPIVVRCITETFGASFWVLYDDVYTKVPHKPERAMGGKAESTPLPVVENMSTTEFIECSDDDRAYWWTPDGDIELSREFYAWMDSLKEQLKEFAAKPPMSPDEFFPYMIRVLNRANENQKHYLLAFGTMYDDYLANPSDPYRQASIHVFSKLLDEYDEKFPTQNPRESTILKWSPEGESEEEYEFAENIRRYLAVLGNLTLRKEVFGF